MSIFQPKKRNLYPYAVRNASSDFFEVDNYIISDFVLKKLVPVVGIQPFPLPELCLMAGTVVRFKPEFIFDWGTHIGKSPRIFHETVQSFGLNSEIHSIDLPDDVEHVEHPGAGRGALVRKIKKVNLHQGDGVTKALEILSGRSNAMFFVDGDHSYETVLRELSLIFEQAPNSTVLLHDTFFQSPDSNYNTGPHRAITDALSKYSTNHKRLDTSFGLPGMTLLYVGAP